MPIRFETFLETPHQVLQQIFLALNLPDEPGPGRFASETLIHPLDEKTVVADVRSTLRARESPCNHWSDNEQLEFRSRCGEAMSLLGYQIPF